MKGFVQAHPTLAASSALFAFFIARLLAVSGYNRVLALAILRQASPVDAAIGLLLEITGLIAAVILPVFAASLVLRPRSRTAWRIRLVAGSAVVAFFLSPLIYLAIYGALTIALEFGERALPRKHRSRTRKSPSLGAKEPSPSQPKRASQPKRVVYAVTFMLGSMAFMWPNPWLPSERLDLYSRRYPIVGYVLSEDEGFLYVLTHGKDGQSSSVRSREYLRLPHSSIRARSLCEFQSDFPAGIWWQYSPVRALRRDGAIVPPCPMQRAG